MAWAALQFGAYSRSAVRFCTALRTFSSKGILPTYSSVTSKNRSHTLLSLPNMERPSWALRVMLATRSEEHTSELQSRGHLVCRLLLEKKHRIWILPSLA